MNTVEKIESPLKEPPLDLRGFDRPRNLLDEIEEDLAPLIELVRRPVVSSRQFNRNQILQLARLAARFETQPQLITRQLTGKIMISAFYEPSTRTRLSFESAWHRLGGDIMSITDVSSTGIAKGESYADVAQMLNNYGDMVVLRDGEESSVYEMLEVLNIPIINGGNGMDEHPTQALADIYALLKWNLECFLDKDSSKVRMGIVGVPERMRTVRSLLLMMANFSQSFEEVVVITDEEAPVSDELWAELNEKGLNIRVTSAFEKTLPTLDVIYQNAILWKGGEYESLGKRFRLDGSSPLKSTAIVLHPLARGPELSTELDKTSHNWYFSQARGAVFIRMALLSAILKIFI